MTAPLESVREAEVESLRRLLRESEARCTALRATLEETQLRLCSEVCGVYHALECTSAAEALAPLDEGGA